MTFPPASLDPPPLAFLRLATLAATARARVDLCRVTAGPSEGEIVAVKRLPIRLAEDPEWRAMFRDEIWMASLLRHPNVTRVVGWGEDEEGLFLAAEFVRGVSLARLLRTVARTGEHFPERLVVFIGEQIAAGLAAAHHLRAPDGQLLNFVHRKLTPNNLLVGFDGTVKITDFGLAKAKQRVTQTAIGMIKGEPTYMSPEQVMGQPLDGRSDLFALGVVLYELFALKPPWVVDGVADALAHIVQGGPVDLGIDCPRLDPALVTVVARCLAKDRAQRYQSASELSDRLGEWLSLHGYDENQQSLGRFVRRNAMRQMRWVERAVAGELSAADAFASPLEASLDGLAPADATPASAEHALSPGEDTPGEVDLSDEPTRSHRDLRATRLARGRPSETPVPPTQRRRDEAPPFGADGERSILEAAPSTAPLVQDLAQDLPRLLQELRHEAVAAVERLEAARAQAADALHRLDHAAYEADRASQEARVAFDLAAQRGEALRLAIHASDQAAAGDWAGARATLAHVVEVTRTEPRG